MFTNSPTVFKLLPIIASVLFLFFSAQTARAQLKDDPDLEALIQLYQHSAPTASGELLNLTVEREITTLIQDLIAAQYTDEAARRLAVNRALNELKTYLIESDHLTERLIILFTYDVPNPHVSKDDTYMDRLREYIENILIQKKSRALPSLFRVIQNKEIAVRAWAASIAIDSIGNLPDEQLPVLTKILNDSLETNTAVRFWAAYGLSERGFQSEAITAAAFDELRKGNPYYRARAAQVLEKSGDFSRQYSDELFRILNEQDEKYRAAIEQLSEQRQANAAKYNSQKDVTFFEERQYNHTQNHVWYLALVRAELARVLASQGANPTKIVHLLVDMIMSDPIQLTFSNVRFGADAGDVFSVVRAFKGLGPEAVNALLPLYEANPRGPHRRDLIVALGYVGEPAVQAIPQLFNDLMDRDLVSFRHDVVVAIGRIGSAVPDIAIPKLIAIHKSRQLNLDVSAGEALDDLARNLKDTDRGIGYINLLKEAQAELVRNDREDVKKNADTLGSAIEILNARWWALLFESQFFSYGIYLVPHLVLLAIWFALFLLEPYYLFRINERLSKFPIEYRFLGTISGPIRYILLVGFFHYRLRVLDAWVAKHVKNAELRFSSRSTVKARTHYVPIPVEIDGRKLSSLKSETLQPLFERTAVALMVSGEGGVGKTSLACLIGSWGINVDQELRLCKHHMLPVLIEQDLEILVDNTATNVVERTIQLQIKTYAQQEEVPSAELVQHLLKHKRLIVIVDGFSEFEESVRRKVIADIARLPINALIFTSRHAEYLENFAPTQIEPMKIGGEFLSDFLGTYLTELKVRQRFDDEEFFELCRRISLLSNSRLVTALLVKLFADLAVAVNQKVMDEDLPQNLPDVFLYYVNYLNRDFDKGMTTNEKVQSFVRVVAWHCLRNNLHPSQANTREVLQAFGDSDNSAALLEHLEQRLNLIRRVGVSRERLRFVLEPLSEYLAAMYWIEANGNDEDQWEALLARIAPSSQNEISKGGFIHALQDCCATKYADVIPQFVPVELERLSGIGMDELLAKNAQRRVRQILQDLTVLDGKSLDIIKTKLGSDLGFAPQ
jgi:hypothetical protein